MEKIYRRITFLLEDEVKYIEMERDKLAEDFIIALIIISLLREKSIEVISEFIDSIKRKIEFIDDNGQEEDSIKFSN